MKVSGTFGRVHRGNENENGLTSESGFTERSYGRRGDWTVVGEKEIE